MICPFLGIMSLIYIKRSQAEFKKGNYEEAYLKGRIGKYWAGAAIATGLTIIGGVTGIYLYLKYLNVI